MNENLFSQSYNQIINGALGGDAPNFQMLGTPMAFNWAPAPQGELNSHAYQVISGMPRWSPLGAYSTLDASFADSYRQALHHISFKVSPERQKDLNALRIQVTLRENEMSQAITNLNQAYLSQRQNGGAYFERKYPDVDTWVDLGPGKTYAQICDNANLAFRRASQLVFEVEMAGMPASLQSSIDAIKLPSGSPGSGPAPRGWTKVQDGSGVLRYQPDYIVGKDGDTWREELKKGSIGSFSVTLKASDQTVDYSRSWAQASASYDKPFWGVSASGSWEKMDLTATDKNVTATIAVKSSTIVPVTPGAWYDGGFMADVARGKGGGYEILNPWVAKGGEGSSSLFGQHGLLASRISGLVVAYQPRFSIEMSEATYERHYEKFEASLSLRIGPFSFGGSGGHESNYEHSTDGKTTFEGGSTSEDPIIIGVLVSFPGLNQA
ncbi:hypothetical protein HUA76_34865 [Myxococcus sp. CA056]|uniref:hypothetical protein n=1 Tax=Myxococcus sp. CA056 TaxID=2741740 RepID=UPI00157A2AE5|nr:hypothetical protein [Myxococcus sp. CA056]NTX15964.1 hypothetical protein [Myxococcus sp. CA056]